MTTKNTEPTDEPIADDDTEGHSIGAAIAMSGMLGSRSSQPQYAKEDALPLASKEERKRSADKNAPKGK